MNIKKSLNNVVSTEDMKTAKTYGQNLMVESALYYADRFGFSVIPIKPDKTPYIQWGKYQKRKPSNDEIRKWWSLWPNAMIGIVTGNISNLFVTDCDTQEGYEAIQGLIPDSLISPIARTPRAGWHLYFLMPKNFKLTIGVGVLPSVDIRGEGGYVVAPPSVNGTGNVYTWQEGLSIDEVEPPPLPAALYNKINNSIYKGTNKTNRQESSLPSDVVNFFHEGRRDNDIFHLANCLVKGGYETTMVEYVVNIIGENCIPPFPKNEIKEKIASALKRTERRQRNIAAEIREWVLSSNGVFFSSEIAKELHLSSRDEMKQLSKTLSRLCEAPQNLIERYGHKNACFRRITTEIEPVNFLTAPTEEFQITLPLDVHKHCIIYPGNIIVVAGSKSAGKTAFTLNTVRLNKDYREIVYLNSEMGDTEFRNRLELFEDMHLDEWKFKPFHMKGNFHDLVTSEPKIFIVDYLEVVKDFWIVAEEISNIHRKLKDGICIIAIQKSQDKELGRGGDFSTEKARLYLSLDYDKKKKVNRIEIVDAKAWRTSDNPRGKCLYYKLVKGSQYKPQGRWE